MLIFNIGCGGSTPPHRSIYLLFFTYFLMQSFPFTIIKDDGELIASFSPETDEEIVLAKGYDILTDEDPVFESIDWKVFYRKK